MTPPPRPAGVLLPRGLLWLARVAALALVAALPLWADGGHIALHATAGAYTITLFTAPTPLVAGQSDLSLLVQDASTGEVLGDATATATLFSDRTPDRTPGKDGNAPPPAKLPLTHAPAGNQLLLSAAPVLRAAASYTLVLQVARPGSLPASFSTMLTVAPDHRRRSTLLFALFLPLAAILLFLVNQQVKRRASLRLSRPHPAIPS